MSLPCFVPYGPSFRLTMRKSSAQSQNRLRLFPRLHRRAPEPSGVRMTSAVENPSETIRFESLFSNPSDATVLTPQSEPVSLIDHVNSRNNLGEVVLLGWLRHYGCTLCKKQTADWLSIQPRLEESDKVCMTLIGNGTPAQAADFKHEMSWNQYIFTDPDRSTYKALQFRTGLSSTFTLPALGKTIASFKEGNKQTWKRMPTDAFQQGGAVLVDRTGVVQLVHADAFAGDHLEKDQLLQEIRVLTN